MAGIGDILKLRQKAEESSASLPALMVRAENIADNIMHGEHAQKKAGAGEKFWQFREYHTSDRPQDIDWRQSAKTDHVFIKQREWQTTQRTYLWCAGGKTMDYPSDKNTISKQDCAQLMCLSLALLLRKAEEQIGVFGDLKTGRSAQTMQKIGQHLIDLPKHGQALPDTAHFDLPRHASFIGAGDFLSPLEDIETRFNHIAAYAQNALIIHILDPTELTLALSGRLRFQGPDDSEHLINHVPSIREEYQNRITEHVNAVQSLCEERGWFYIRHTTDLDISATLQHIWGMTQIHEVHA